MIVVLIFAVIVDHTYSAELLRTPKVYNALITTDQNLTPSRAYPVIQPTIHDSPFVYSPYNFSPYGFYDPFGFNEFGGNAQPLFSRYNGNIQNNRAEFGNNQAAAAAAAQASVASNSIGNDRSFAVNRNSENRNTIVANDKSPIPLNEFGLPPSLVPIAPYGNVNQNPINLAPYNYNSYPLIFDQFGGFQQGPYLPHFGNVPQNAYAAFGGANRPPPNENSAFGNTAGGDAPNGFGPNEVIGNRQQTNGDIGNRNVIGLPGSASGSEQVSFNRENFNGINGGAQRADFVQSSSSHGSIGDGQASSVQSNFQHSSSSASTVSSTSSSANDGNGIAQTSGSLRNGRTFYFNDDIKNNKNRNENIVDVPPPPLPFGARSIDEQ